MILKVRLAYGVPALIKFTYHLSEMGMGGSVPVGQSKPGEKPLHAFSFWVDGKQKYSSDEVYEGVYLVTAGGKYNRDETMVTSTKTPHEDHVDQIVTVALNEESMQNVFEDRTTTLQWRFTRCADDGMDVRAVVEEVQVAGVESVGEGDLREQGGGVACVDCPSGRYPWTPDLKIWKPSSFPSAECKPCPAGKTSKSGSTDCTACPADTFSFQHALKSDGAAGSGSSGSISGSGGGSSSECLPCGSLTHSVPASSSCQVGQGGGTGTDDKTGQLYFKSSHAKFAVEVMDLKPKNDKKAGKKGGKDKQSQSGGASGGASGSSASIITTEENGSQHQHGPVRARPGEATRIYYYNISAVRKMFELRTLADGTGSDASSTRRVAGTVGGVGATSTMAAARKLGPMVVVRARGTGSGAGIVDDENGGGHIRQFHLGGLDRGLPSLTVSGRRANKLNITAIMATMQPPLPLQGTYGAEIVLYNANVSSRLVEKSIGTQGKMLCRVPPVYGESGVMPLLILNSLGLSLSSSFLPFRFFLVQAPSTSGPL
jgi:hypothetical protein